MEAAIKQHESVIYPSLADRVQSTFIDMLLIIAMIFVASTILERFEIVPDWVRISIFIGIWVVYEPLAMTLGFTVGNYLKGLRVRRSSSPNKKINFFQALIRYVLKMLLGWLSFLTMHGDDKKRALHDLAAGSVVLKIN